MLVDDFLGVHEVEERHPGQRRESRRQVEPKPVMIRMWCDGCKHIIVRSPSGTDHGHQVKWCDGGGGSLMWELPPAKPIPVSKAIDEVEQLVEADDVELESSLRQLIGSNSLQPEDLALLREQMELIVTERQQLELLAKELED